MLPSTVQQNAAPEVDTEPALVARYQCRQCKTIYSTRVAMEACAKCREETVVLSDDDDDDNDAEFESDCPPLQPWQRVGCRRGRGQPSRLETDTHGSAHADQTRTRK
jgi:hypothetical protein